jgi:hypothetical protein
MRVFVFYCLLTRLDNLRKTQHVLETVTHRLISCGCIVELLETDLVGAPRVGEDSVRRYFGVIVEAFEAQRRSIDESHGA